MGLHKISHHIHSSKAQKSDNSPPWNPNPPPPSSRMIRLGNPLIGSTVTPLGYGLVLKHSETLTSAPSVAAWMRSGSRSNAPWRCMSWSTELLRTIWRGGHFGTGTLSSASCCAASSRTSSRKYGSNSPSRREIRNQPRALSSREQRGKRQNMAPRGGRGGGGWLVDYLTSTR